MSHTKEPWEAFCDVCESSTPHPDSEPIVRIGFDDYVRARACVNALAGVTTEELEQSGFIGGLLEQVECSTITRDNMEGRLNIATVKLAAMKEQRDDLLAALEMAVKEFEYARNHLDGEPHCSATMAIMHMDDAIARVKGGA